MHIAMFFLITALIQVVCAGKLQKISVQKIESEATAKLSPGDLVFFMKTPKDDFTKGVISCSKGDTNIYHVAMVVKNDKSHHLTVMHTLPTKGVVKVSLAEAIHKLKPGMVELTKMNVEQDWKNRAAEWAAEQDGVEYNDVFSPNQINSRGKKALYCSELVVEAFKNTFVANPDLEDDQNANPFPPHKMTFSNHDGSPNEFWIKYYEDLGCKEYPTPPKGQDGSHPSIMRMSHVVEHVAKYEVNDSAH